MEDATHTHAPHVHAAPANLGARLLLSIVINVAITLAQVVGGLVSGSLALLSDAAHNASDVIGLVLSYGAHRVGKLPATQTRTFAFKRAEVLAAFVNAAGLLAVSVWILVEGVQRLGSPAPVQRGIVAILAGLGLVGNTLAAALLHGGRDLNTRSAYLHLVADAVTSLGVLLGGLVMVLTGWGAVDAIVSILLAIWMIRESYAIVRASTDILMEAVPAGVAVADVEQLILAAPLLEEVHDLHVWSLSSTELALSAHVVSGCEDLPALSRVIATLKEELRMHYGIGHVTLELECAGGECAGGGCALPRA